jgi:hypothetical protein
VIRVSAVAARGRGSVFSLGSANAKVLATPLQTELHTFSFVYLDSSLTNLDTGSELYK